MSDGDPPKPDVSKIPLSPVVKAAAQSITSFYSAAIEAMSSDVTALVTKNGASNPPPAKGVKALTTDMITLLGARLRTAFPKTCSGSNKSASPDDTETP